MSLIPLQTVLLGERKVFLESESTISVACEIAKQLTYLCSRSHEKIDMIICSPGGELKAGLMLYDHIQACPAPIRTICTGYAYSMAALLFACGQHGRYMLPNSELMLHEPTLGSKISGNASSIQSASEGLQRSKQKITSILAKHTNNTTDVIEKAISYDHFYTAEEAVDFGLADRIIGVWDLEGTL